MRFLTLIPITIALAFASLTAGSQNAAWLVPSVAHPMGTDEFGRDILLVLAIAVGRSVTSGAFLAAVSIFVSTLVAYAVAIYRIHFAAVALKVLVQIIESIPTFIWVLAAFAALRGVSRLIIAVTFVFALLPAVSSIISGEFSRLYSEPFIEASRLLRVGRSQLLIRHILPNALPVLLPLFVQVLGTAIAIRGAIGLLGFSARTDYDLGIIILRGKENTVSHPMLMASAIATIALIYVYLDWLRRHLLVRQAAVVDLIQSDAMLR